MTVRQGSRVRAPEFPKGSWFNASGPLSLRGLRGKIVLLDFWTFCCANCLHVVDELRVLEAAFPDELVIIGVHSPKFEHEKSDRAVAAATERYQIGHPVFNDPGLQLWKQYAVHAWPTLVLIDPDGYVVAQAAGEGQVSALRLIISELIDRHAATLQRGDNRYLAAAAVPRSLHFPAKAARRGDTLFIADAGHHQIVETELDGETVRRRIGTGQRSPDSFAEPNGLAVVPAELGLGFDLLVADTANHVLRGVRLADGAIVRTIELASGLAETQTVTGPVPAALSPWDVVWWPAIEKFAIAAAGVHLLLAWDPATDTVSILAGTTVEGLKDGPAHDGWLAQPSGLAVDGDRLWFADSETSALRYLTADGQLHTRVGAGLFEFGHTDGPAAVARLQHPLGVAVLEDGSIAIADTYNSSIRRYDPLADEVSTLATDLAEPSGLLVVDGELIVVESAAHRLVRPIIAGQQHRVLGEPSRTERPETRLAAGTVELTVAFVAPPGRKVDDRYGPSCQLTVSASPAELLMSGAGTDTDLTRTLVFGSGRGVLHVTAQAASCDDDPANPHPACHLARQDWGVPIELVAGGDSKLGLVLLG